MIPWDEQKQASDLYWANRRRPAQDAQMLKAAGAAKARVEQSPLEKIGGFLSDLARNLAGGEGVGTFQQDFTIAPAPIPPNVGTGPRRSSVPMPQVTPARPPASKPWNRDMPVVGEV